MRCPLYRQRERSAVAKSITNSNLLSGHTPSNRHIYCASASFIMTAGERLVATVPTILLHLTWQQHRKRYSGSKANLWSRRSVYSFLSSFHSFFDSHYVLLPSPTSHFPLFLSFVSLCPLLIYSLQSPFLAPFFFLPLFLFNSFIP